MPRTNLLKSLTRSNPEPAANKRKLKSRDVSLKLSYEQYLALEKFCRKHETTPVRLIKAVIIKQIERYRRELPQQPVVVKNQLELF